MLVPTVIAFLSLLWLSTGVVLARFSLRGARFGGLCGPLQFAHSRFDLIYKADVFVILHDLAGGGILLSLDGGWTKVHMSHIRRLHTGDAQRH